MRLDYAGEERACDMCAIPFPLGYNYFSDHRFNETGLAGALCEACSHVTEHFTEERLRMVFLFLAKIDAIEPDDAGAQSTEEDKALTEIQDAISAYCMGARLASNERIEFLATVGNLISNAIRDEVRAAREAA